MRAYIEVRTEYPHKFLEGDKLYDKDGFLIGTIRGPIDLDWEREDAVREYQQAIEATR